MTDSVVKRLSGGAVTASLWPALSDDDLDRAIAQALMEEVRETWIALAESQLHTSLDAYLSALGPVEDEGRSFSITFGGTDTPEENRAFALALEKGAPAWNMRSTMLEGRDSRVVRFQYGSTSADATRVRPLGYQYRNLRPGVRKAAVAALIAEMRTQQGAPVRPGTTRRVTKHRRDAYAGLQMDTSPKATAARGAIVPGAGRGGRAGPTYSVYRTMNWDQPADMWIRPPIEAHKFGEQALAQVAEASAPIIERALAAVLQAQLEADIVRGLR